MQVFGIAGYVRHLYEHGDRSGLNPDHVEKIRQILSALEAAERPEELALPGFHFHRLTGNRRGYFSVTVRANWRVTFRFEEGKAYEVHVEDDH